ncbi:hypothetical protein V5O48_012668 [Marasmius crinis-equi]|uniref:F-box domain-containing protein n=1 Tax=Marasmius crinis-equi TaxID=585013 RepID=A0ABR3F288_9AGAR
MKATFPSRFTNLLGTNYAPSSEEVVEIKSLLRDPEERLHSLDAEISKLQAERDELRQDIDRHRMLLSPFRRLPADLWGEIFVQALPSNEFNLPGRTLKDAPLLLTTVCRTWRDIALRTPRLWNGIHVYFPRQNRRHRAVQLPSLLRARKEGVKAWLDRSGSLPITLSLAVGPGPVPFPVPVADGSDPNPDWPELDTALSSFLELLVQYCRRLQAIKLCRELDGRWSPMVWQPFASLTPNDLPLLEDVHMRSALFSYDSSTGADTPTPLAQMLYKLPGLRKIHISGEALGSILNLKLFERLRLSSVTDLHLAPYDIPEPVSLMSSLAESCPSLSSLSLVMHLGRRVPRQDQESHVTPPPLKWSALRSFELHLSDEPPGFDPHNGDDFCDILSAMFRRLRVPALDRLTVRVTRPGYMHDSNPGVYVGSTMPFHDMIVRSSSPIRHLSLDLFFYSNTEALSRTLTILPSLKSLRLSKAGTRQRRDEVNGLEEVLRLLSRLSLTHAIGSGIEELDLRICEIGDADTIIATTTTMPELKSLIVEFRDVHVDVARETMHSNRVREGLRYLREVKGTRVIWKWQNHYYNDWFYLDHPYAGIVGSLPYPGRELEYEFL